MRVQEIIVEAVLKGNLICSRRTKKTNAMRQTSKTKHRAGDNPPDQGRNPPHGNATKHSRAVPKEIKKGAGTFPALDL